MERVGTRCYMAPEVFQQKAYSLSADVYAIGRCQCPAPTCVCRNTSPHRFYSIFYELLSLQKPQDVNPRMTFDWSRVPSEYEPSMLQVPSLPLQLQPAAPTCLTPLPNLSHPAVLCLPATQSDGQS